ncbi:TPM domain-containing protein [Geomonas azotofigens]|uniref:TPM domain-containing protein n=1 Tax=Geomonas azotofigens TaxID=2843196 RepID=UPI001C10FB4B|nr:TPM domain-containing protein [Geomonas azotofigens]MBU5612371.1 TPM domain-containing protein [Geomonas azotofigens]
MDLSHKSLAHDFFSQADKEAIRQAVARAEALSSGEIATMVVSESDRYREAEALGALLLSGFVCVVIAVLTHHVTIWTYIPVVFLLYFPVLLFLRRFPRFKLSFVGPRRLAEAVSERALVAFYQQGLYRTRGETGILIFISLLERKVWIVGDRGINEKIAPGYWKSLAERLAQGLRAGRGAQAVCEVIAACGSELERHFPRGKDDRNELSDEIIIS